MSNCSDRTPFGAGELEDDGRRVLSRDARFPCVIMALCMFRSSFMNSGNSDKDSSRSKGLTGVGSREGVRG